MFYKPYFEDSENAWRKNGLPLYCWRITSGPISDEIMTIYTNWHNGMEFIYSEAALELYINNSKINVVPEDIIFVNPRLIHRACRQSMGDIYAIIFDLNLLSIPCQNPSAESLIIDAILNQKKQFCTKPDPSTELYRRLKPHIATITEYACKNIPAGEDACRIMSCLYQIMAECYHADFFEDVRQPHCMNYILELINYIDENYNSDITISSLSQMMNLTDAYLYRLFREYIGSSPKNYINSIRIREACRLLMEGKNVTETAVSVGIPNISYFIKVFKNATGYPPHQWTKNYFQENRADG